MTIIAGTTPTFEYTFSTVTVANITTAVFTVKQNGRAVIEKELSDAVVSTGKLSWTLSQAESLSLAVGKSTMIYLDYVLTDGTRGAGITQSVEVVAAGKNEVI